MRSGSLGHCTIKGAESVWGSQGRDEMKSRATTINAPTALLPFFYFLLLFYSFYNKDRYDKNAFKKKKKLKGAINVTARPL